MNQHHEEKFLKSVIKVEQHHKNYLKDCDKNDSYSLGFYYGSINGLGVAIRLFAAQTGKSMLDGESIKEYYRRWLSMEYSQLDILDMMRHLEEETEVVE